MTDPLSLSQGANKASSTKSEIEVNAFRSWATRTAVAALHNHYLCGSTSSLIEKERLTALHFNASYGSPYITYFNNH